MTDERREEEAEAILQNAYTDCGCGIPSPFDQVARYAVMLALGSLSITPQKQGSLLGMRPWAGGEAAPRDWDGGKVLTRKGKMSRVDGPHRWSNRRQNRRPGSDIVAYSASSPNPPKVVQP